MWTYSVALDMDMQEALWGCITGVLGIAVTHTVVSKLHTH